MYVKHNLAADSPTFCSAHSVQSATEFSDEAYAESRCRPSCQLTCTLTDMGHYATAPPAS